MLEKSYREPIRKIPLTHSHFFVNGQNLTGQDVSLTRQNIESKANQEKKHVEGEIFLPDTPVDSSIKVKEGLDYMLSLFSEPLFPIKIMRSAVNRRQYEMLDKEEALYYYKAALYEDCRISAFGINQKNPDLIFIEIDAKDFRSRRAFEMALKKTLKRIKQKLDGAHPAVNWSGRGYHIIQPIQCPVNLDIIDNFAALIDDGGVNKAFLQFGASYLSDNKKDSCNRPSLKSCQLRVPGSINSKCRDMGIDGEVKIVQRWDGCRPDYSLLLGSFYAYLVGEYEKEQSRYRDYADASESSMNYAPGVDYGPIGWIEKLLQTPIDDYRYHSRNLILVPYLVLTRGITDVDEVTEIVMEWADRCAELRRLEPSRREFQKGTRKRFHVVIRDRIPPMRLEKLKEKKPKLYGQLHVPG